MTGHKARSIAGASSALLALAFTTAASRGHAQEIVIDQRELPDPALPPWAEANDVPVPAWARSIAPNKVDAALYAEPGKLESRRGSAQLGAKLPLFATVRANGCLGRWFNVGPLAWICSDVADYAGDPPSAPMLGTRAWTLPAPVTPDGVRPSRPGARPLPPIDPTSATDDGLPYRYFFAGRDGAYGFSNLANALDDAPDQELEQGFAVASLEEKTAHGETWQKTRKNRWIATRELIPARSNVFHGALVADGKLDFGWVTADKASVFATAKADKANGARSRFERLPIREFVADKNGGMVRISEDKDPPQWVRAKDIARPTLSSPPAEASSEERWVDVDLAQQTLVAYDGTKPVFATIISSGKGAPKSDTATPVGVHRIWVKIFTTKMDNLDKEDVEHHYAIEDVPFVQFFDKAVALHAAFWHNDFGRMHSHGCVNMAPLDARWLFAFTGPHLPNGWTAVFPTRIEQGTVIRVR